MRAIASWSQTYGITDDVIPTPIPASSTTGSTSAGTASQPPSGVATTQRDEHGGGEPVDPGHRPVLRHAVRDDDVEGEERRVGEGERQPDRLGRELDVREQVDAADGEHERGAVPERPRARAPRAGSPGRNSIAATVPSGSRSMAT